MRPHEPISLPDVVANSSFERSEDAGLPRGFSLPISGSPASTGGRVFAVASVGAMIPWARKTSRAGRMSFANRWDIDAFMASLAWSTGTS